MEDIMYYGSWQPGPGPDRVEFHSSIDFEAGTTLRCVLDKPQRRLTLFWVAQQADANGDVHDDEQVLGVIPLPDCLIVQGRDGGRSDD